MAEATATLTLADFLLARIAEDEVAARDAGSAPWVAMETAPWVQVDPAAIRDAKWKFGKQGYVASADSNAHAAHIARQHPARVLAECEAKRRIVDVHRDKGNGFCDECDWGMPCPTLRLLALPSAGHPDYREEWRP